MAKDVHPDRPPAAGFFGRSDLSALDALRRWPLFLARFEWLKVRQMYRSARGPAAVLIWTNLLWIVPIAIYTQYAQVFAREVGLSVVQVGYLSSLTMASSVVFYLVGGWLTDRLGYLKTILLFDTLSWPVPMAILAAASQAWHFYAAALLAGTMAAVAPGWNALFVSKVLPERRAAAYGMLQITLTLPGLVFPLLGGWLVGRFGLLLSMRCVYLATAWLTALGTVVRWIVLPSTPPLQKVTTHPVVSVLDQLGRYARMVTRPGMSTFMLALLLVNVDIYVGGVFVSLYCMEYLGMAKQDYAWVSAAASVVRLGGILIMAPLITTANTRRFLVIAACCLGLGSLTYVVLLGSPHAGVPFLPGVRVPLLPTVIAATVCWAVGGAIWGPAIMAQWVNMIPERTRSRLWGAHGAVNQLVGAAAVAGVGHLYHFCQPFLLGVFIALETAAAVLFAASPVGTARAPEVTGE